MLGWIIIYEACYTSALSTGYTRTFSILFFEPGIMTEVSCFVPCFEGLSPGNEIQMQTKLIAGNKACDSS